jgi:hypothetical protein
MSVEYVSDIYKLFLSKKKAQKASWYYRTLVFCMFAEFGYMTAERSKWREDIVVYCKEKIIDFIF